MVRAFSRSTESDKPSITIRSGPLADSEVRSLEFLPRINWPRLYAEMDAAGIDVLLGGSLQNFFWITNVYLMSHSMLPERLSIAVVPREGEPAAFVSTAEALQTRQESWISDVPTWVERDETAMEPLAAYLAGRGLGEARIGIESGFLAAGHAEELAGRLPAAQLVAGDDVFQRARAIKHPDEIETLKRGAIATEAAIRSALQRARPGVTEKEVSDDIMNGVIHAGGVAPWVVFGSGDRTAINHPYGGSKSLTPGEVVRVDVGATFDGYQSDVARTAAVGEPDAATGETYRRLRSAQAEIIALMRPGTPAREILLAARKAMSERGFEMRARAVGHGIGTGLHDYPMLTEHEYGELQPGMVLPIEPAGRDARGWLYHTEDTVLVTDGPPTVLTDIASWEEMMVVG